MSHPENFDEWIENYLDNKLTKQELLWFENQIASNPELSNMLENRQYLQEKWTKAILLDNARKEVLDAILKEKRAKRKKLLSLTAAASIIIAVAIPGILYYSGNFNLQPMIAEKVITPDAETETVVTPQLKSIEEKASFGVADSLTLLAPINNQQCNKSHYIVFRWKPVLADTTHIIIENITYNKVVFKEKIPEGKQNFILEKGFLPDGQYNWYLEGIISKASFEVIK